MLTSGARMSLRGEHKYNGTYVRIHLQLGPSRLHTYSVAYLRGVKNCNGKFQNTRIVMAFLQL
jgi:hypothetical protein